MRKTISILLALLLALSPAGKVSLHRMCRLFYVREGMQRLDPLGLAVIPRVTDLKTGTNVVFFGDRR